MNRSPHPIQQQMFQLAIEHDISNMRLTELSRLLGGIHVQQVKHHREMLIKHGELTNANSPKVATVTTYPDGMEIISIPIMGIVS